MSDYNDNRLREIGDDLEDAVKMTLSALEQQSLPARDADEFVRDCVFNAWWAWEYAPIP